MTSGKKERTDIVALILGLSIFAFGFLKLFDPFHTWFHVQIAKGSLPAGAFPLREDRQRTRKRRGPAGGVIPRPALLLFFPECLYRR